MGRINVYYVHTSHLHQIMYYVCFITKDIHVHAWY